MRSYSTFLGFRLTFNSNRVHYQDTPNRLPVKFLNKTFEFSRGNSKSEHDSFAVLKQVEWSKKMHVFYSPSFLISTCQRSGQSSFQKNDPFPEERPSDKRTSTLNDSNLLHKKQCRTLLTAVH